MAVLYTVCADIVDIRSDIPNKQDKFWVDTNVWFWMTYTKLVNQRSYQINDYPMYVKSIRRSGAILFHTALTFAELSNTIERAEHSIFVNNGGTNSFKEFRHNHTNERQSSVVECSLSWAQVESMSNLIECAIDVSSIADAVSRMSNQNADVGDMFHIQSIGRNMINNVITDDGDFCTIPGITVFTANRTVINQARRQNRLIRRK